jgi:hypothetical protein
VAPITYTSNSSPLSAVLRHTCCATMEPNAISQIKKLLASASELRESLSNADRLQLMGLTDSLSNELQRPDEAVFRMTFNQVRPT